MSITSKITTADLKEIASQPHILVVDDDERLRILLFRYLSDNGFLVTTATDAADARSKIDVFEFDLLVLDVMMPGEDGLSLTRFLKGKEDTPVLLLTALGDAQARIQGLEAGADDYLPKPFEPRELVLRMNAILRRLPPARGEQTIRLGQWLYDVARGELSNGEQRVPLTTAEATLLKALAQHVGEIVSREELAELCNVSATERTIDVQVTRLRKKVEEDPKSPRYIQTVRGKGYMLWVD